jgi:glycosyltransferase involved in cell wall biosynthesis
MSKPTRVGIDLAPAARGESAPGTARLVTEQARALLALDVDWEWVPLVESDRNPLWPAIEHLKPQIVRGKRWWTRATFQVGTAWKQLGCSLGFATAYFVPWRGIPVVANFFDSNLFEHGHTWVSSGRRWNYHLNRNLCLLSLYRAKRMFILSNYCRDYMARRYPSVAGKLVVTPCGVGSVLPFRDRKPDWATGIFRPFFLYVGVFSDNKNQRRLIEAWGRLQQENVELPALVLIGNCPEDYMSRVIQPCIRGLSRPNEVVLTGKVSDEDLGWAYRQALAYVQPSIAEGFGLPVVEAMSYGLPVACSQSTSLPEVAGNAAVYFDPFNVDSMVPVLKRLWLDETLRRQLSALGLERCKTFTWENNAAIVAREINSLLRALPAAKH